MLYLLLRRGALAIGLWFAQTAYATEPLSLESALALALANNPSLAVIEARAEALATLEHQSAALPDPRLSLNLANLPLDTFSFTQEGMTQLQLGISQALPYPGKLALRSEAAKQMAKATGQELAERHLQLAQDVKTVWWNLVYLEQAIAVIQRNQTLLEQFINVAEVRYQVGQGQQQDILLAQLELSKLQDNAIALSRQRQSQTMQLNLLLDREPTFPIQLTGAHNEKLPSLKPLELLQQQAINQHPQLLAQQARIAAAQNQLDLAKKDYAPDFTIGAVYGLRNGNNADGSDRADFASLMFSMNLPLFNHARQDAAVDQRNAEWKQQRFQLLDQQRKIMTRIAQAASDYQFAAEQANLAHQETIPLAQQSIDTLLAGYQVGKVDFLSLIRSQTALYNYETRYWQSLSQANQALARLVAAVGEEQIYE